VTGGIAGVEYSYILAGAEGVVRGESCIRGCDFEAGEILASVSGTQTELLAGRFEDGGVLDLDGADFGVLCCDIFHLDLSYAHGDGAARLRGSSELFPAAIAAGLQTLAQMAAGVMPAFVTAAGSPAGWPQDAVLLDSLSRDGELLSATVTFSGGCESHTIDLVAWGGWMESFPVQVRALLAHDDRGDPCDGILTQEVMFDLSPLRQAYETAYGPGAGVILLNLGVPGGEDRIVEYRFS
jgi:hypothetical protein